MRASCSCSAQSTCGRTYVSSFFRVGVCDITKVSLPLLPSTSPWPVSYPFTPHPVLFVSPTPSASLIRPQARSLSCLGVPPPLWLLFLLRIFFLLIGEHVGCHSPTTTAAAILIVTHLPFLFLVGVTMPFSFFVVTNQLCIRANSSAFVHVNHVDAVVSPWVVLVVVTAMTVTAMVGVRSSSMAL